MVAPHSVCFTLLLSNQYISSLAQNISRLNLTVHNLACEWIFCCCVWNKIERRRRINGLHIFTGFGFFFFFHFFSLWRWQSTYIRRASHLPDWLIYKGAQATTNEWKFVSYAWCSHPKSRNECKAAVIFGWMRNSTKHDRMTRYTWNCVQNFIKLKENRMSELIRLYVYSSLDNIYGPVGSWHVRDDDDDDDNNVTEILLFVVAMKTATAAMAMMCVVFQFNCENSTERSEEKKLHLYSPLAIIIYEFTS